MSYSGPRSIHLIVPGRLTTSSPSNLAVLCGSLAAHMAIWPTPTRCASALLFHQSVRPIVLHGLPVHGHQPLWWRRLCHACVREETLIDLALDVPQHPSMAIRPSHILSMALSAILTLGVDGTVCVAFCRSFALSQDTSEICSLL